MAESLFKILPSINIYNGLNLEVLILFLLNLGALPFTSMVVCLSRKEEPQDMTLCFFKTPSELSSLAAEQRDVTVSLLLNPLGGACKVPLVDLR